MSETAPRKANLHKRPTVVDVARVAGVSVGTVSNALNDRRYVDADTKARIKVAVQALGYTPNVRAQRLRTGRADTIGIFVTLPFAAAAGPTRYGYTMEVAAVAAGEAAQMGMALMLVPPLDGNPERLDTFHVDGAILVEPSGRNSTIEHLKNRGVTLVTIGSVPGDPSVPCIDMHARAAIETLLDHLYEQGARRIGFVGGSQGNDLQFQSEEAYKAFTQLKGMEPILRLLPEAEGVDGARTVVEQLLGQHPEIDGLCVPYDPFALGAMQAAENCSRAVPQNLKIVTRYNSIRVQEAQITALDIHLPEVAKLAVDLLLAQMGGVKWPFSVAGPMPTLIPRRSSQS